MVSATRMTVSLKTDLRFPDTGHYGHGSRIIHYSITETAKANNLNPFRYMEYLLTKLMEHLDDTDRSFLEDLLPWSDKLPEICQGNQVKK